MHDLPDRNVTYGVGGWERAEFSINKQFKQPCAKYVTSESHGMAQTPARHSPFKTPSAAQTLINFIHKVISQDHTLYNQI